MADTERIKGNLAKMIDQGAPESDLDAYLASEGFKSQKDWISAIDTRPPLARAWDTAKDVGGEVADFAKRAGEYRDTQFAKAMGGIAGMPRMVSDAAKWVGDKGIPVAGLPFIGPVAQMGGMLPTGDEAGKAMLDVAKARPGFQERSINPVVDAGVQAAFSGPVLGVGGKFGPVMNVAGGMGSEFAGQQFEGTPYEVPARVAGAIAGGGAGALTQKAASAVPALARPFTAGGRDAIVGDALKRAASNPEAATTALDSYLAGRAAYPEKVPGFNLDAGRASRDPGLMAAAETVPQAQRGAMANENNVALTKALDEMATGLPNVENAGSIVQEALGKRVKELTKARSDAVDPLYEAARKSPTPVKPFPLMTYTADAVAQNKGEPAQVMQKARDLLFTTDKNGRTIPDRSARGMMATRDALNDMLSNPELGNYSRSLLQEMKSKVDDALTAVPQAKAANAKFAEMSKPLDPFNPDLGDVNKRLASVIERDQFNKGYLMSPERVPKALMQGGDLSAPMVQHLLQAGGGNPAIRDAMRSAYIADFRKAASSAVAEDAAGSPRLTSNGAETWLQKHRGGAVNVLTPEQVSALDEIASKLKDAAQTPPGRTGSPTFDRLASESILGAMISPQVSKHPMFTPINRALGLVYGGSNEATMARVYEALQDPAIAKALMRKATPQNVKLAEPVLRQLARTPGVALAGEQQ